MPSRAYEIRKRSGITMGPMSSKELRRLAAVGEILPDDEIRDVAKATWQEAGRVKGLVFGAVPSKREDAELRPADSASTPVHPRHSGHPELAARPEEFDENSNLEHEDIGSHQDDADPPAPDFPREGAEESSGEDPGEDPQEASKEDPKEELAGQPRAESDGEPAAAVIEGDQVGGDVEKPVDSEVAIEASPESAEKEVRCMDMPPPDGMNVSPRVDSPAVEDENANDDDGRPPAAVGGALDPIDIGPGSHRPEDPRIDLMIKSLPSTLVDDRPEF